MNCAKNNSKIASSTSFNSQEFSSRQKLYLTPNGEAENKIDFLPSTVKNGGNTIFEGKSREITEQLEAFGYPCSFYDNIV